MSAPESSRGGAGNRLRAPSAASASSSLRPDRPVTPELGGDAVNDQFDRLSAAPSARSRISYISSNRSPSRPTSSTFSRPDDLRRQPSVRIRRNSAASGRGGSTRFPPVSSDAHLFDGFQGIGHAQASQTGRPRSISQPERARVPPPGVNYPGAPARRQPQIALPRLTEEGPRPTMEELGIAGGTPLSPSQSLPEEPPAELDGEVEGDDGTTRRNRGQMMRRVSRILWPGGNRRSDEATERPRRATVNADDEYGTELVDWLDIIDPEVQTLSTLTNVQNTLFVPDLGNWLNRRPTYTLSRREVPPPEAAGAQPPMQPPAELPAVPETIHEKPEPMPDLEGGEAPGIQRSNTISSRLTDSHYAALPHGQTLEGWTAEEKWELDDHVRHMMHSRRSRFKRTMKGFGQYVRRPLGFLVTLYATLITLFGLAWVLFLIGWIYVGSKQDYDIFVIDSVLVALFACMGIGLAPFRTVDTYRMIFILRYTRMIENARKGKRPRSRLQKRNVPPEVRDSMDKLATGRVSSHLSDRPPMVDADGQAYMVPASGVLSRDTGLPPEPRPIDPEMDLEDGQSEESVFLDPLTPKQRKRLEHHQKKLARSHSFYKPSETFTHFPFPMAYLIAIVILVDCHSCLQISLSACTWGINYHVRPFALTTVILCCSITCNITAGIVIMIGDRKTRKKDVWKLLDRQELTGDAIKHLENKREKEHKKKTESESNSSSQERQVQHTSAPE